MRTRLVLVGAAVAAAAVLPAAPASAVCDPVLSALLGRCTNACVESTRVVQNVDEVLGDHVPPTVCPT